ncbi:MAG: hypothetical protein NT167_05705 [Verrucomicrobia bacterium]|nr:hypothetical protein [Verrucomicrobiota bacterium]
MASDSHDFALHLHLKPAFDLRSCTKPFTDGLANVGKSLLAARSLRAAPGQVVAPHGDPFSRFHKRKDDEELRSLSENGGDLQMLPNSNRVVAGIDRLLIDAGVPTVGRKNL